MEVCSVRYKLELSLIGSNPQSFWGRKGARRIHQKEKLPTRMWEKGASKERLRVACRERKREGLFCGSPFPKWKCFALL